MNGRSAFRIGLARRYRAVQPTMLKACKKSHAPPPPETKETKGKKVKLMDTEQEKTQVISFRATQDEEDKYRKDAEIAGLTLSEYIRRRLNGTRIVAKTPLTDRQSVARLKQIGGLIKQLFKYEKISKFELDNSLKEIYSVIGHIQKHDDF